MKSKANSTRWMLIASFIVTVICAVGIFAIFSLGWGIIFEHNLLISLLILLVFSFFSFGAFLYYNIELILKVYRKWKVHSPKMTPLNHPEA